HPGDHDECRLLPSRNTDTVALARQHDQYGADEEGDEGATEQQRSIRVPELRVDFIGHEDRRESADHEKTHDAEVEQSAVAELDVEADRDQRIGAGLDQEPDRERHAHRNEHDGDEPRDGNEQEKGPARRIKGRHVDAPLKMPVGRTRSVITRMTKATVSLYSVGTNARLAGSCKPSGSIGLSGRNTAVQLNTASDSANPISSPPAIAP